MANALHDQVLEFTENYRKIHPEFLYILRTANRKNRLDDGMWFPGNEKYAFVGLVTTNGGQSRTAGMGIAFFPDGKCRFRIDQGDETDPEIINFYSRVVEEIGGFYNSNDKKHRKLISENNSFVEAKIFLDQYLQKIYSLIKDLKLERIKVSPERFDASLAKVKSVLTSKVDDLPVAPSPKKYWIYAPGEKADHWDEFYSKGIMGLGWDELGDLTQYKTKEEIISKLQKLQATDSSKRNDATANFEFKNVIAIGDIIICKKGRTELLGYGVVTSDYFFDDSRQTLKSCRKVDWKKRGNWKIEYSLPLKTLTDITAYETEHPDFKRYFEQLMNEMGVQTITNENSLLPNYPLNLILYGPPGTGKTYNSVQLAAEIVTGSSVSTYKQALDIFNQTLHDQIEFITFHQNYSYEDFIQGIRPDIDNSSLTFEKRDGIFKIIADRALKNLRDSEKDVVQKRDFETVFKDFITPLVEGEQKEIEIKMKKSSYAITDIGNKSIEFKKASGTSDHTMSIATLKKMYDAESVLDIQGLHTYYTPLLERLLQLGRVNSGDTQKIKKKNYVIIIDEINRANISRVFGELITLIEPDKRSHGATPLQVKLPSGDPFVVPSNLYIIGTMNTADKSIALLDIALRRRFEFTPMYPNYQFDNHNIFDADVLKNLNAQIIATKGYDFQIGHSYFMNENEVLTQRMNNKVIPLLLEYYMNEDKEVKSILYKAGLEVEPDSWPIRILGRRG